MRHWVALGILLGICTTAWAQIPDTVRVTFIHSNDVMGQLRGADDSDQQRGGMARRVYYIDSLRSVGETLVLDAGNALGPNALSAWDRGKTMIAAMRMAGYSAMVPGHHEFDHGIDALAECQDAGGFPFLAVNLRSRDGRELPLEGYRTFDVGGVRVGVIGVVSSQFVRKVNPNVASVLTVDNPLEGVQRAVSTLRDLGVPYIVLLAHMSESETMQMAQRVDGVQLVIAGSYARPEQDGRVPTLTRLLNGVHVVTTPRGGSHLGMVQVLFVRQAGTYVAAETDAQTVAIGEAVPKHEATAADIDSLVTLYTAETGDALGTIAGKSRDEQAAVVANLMRWHTKMEVGMVHRGAFRHAVHSDSLYARDIEQFVRFDDALVKMQLTGDQIKSLIKRSKRAGKGDGGLVFAGVDLKREEINGRDIQNKEPYQVVTLAYLAEGGEGYREFGSGVNMQRTSISLRSLVINGLRAWGTLGPETFSLLDRRRVWRSGWAVEGAFRRNYVDDTAEDYQSKKERVSFLRGETSIAWNASTRYFLSYESGPHAVLFENNNDFGQVGRSFGDLETSSDRLDAEATYRRRIQRWQIHPFVNSGISTALTSGNGSRPFQFRSSLGFQRRLGRVTVKFAGRGQRDFAEGQNDFGAEVTATYQRRLQHGGRLRSRVKSFFGLTDRKVISIENYNTLSFPLAGSLSLNVRQNNFLYRVDKIRGVLVNGTAFRTDLTVGLAYGLDWKWF